MTRNILRHFGRLVVYIFALIGFVLVVGFLALRFGWFNTAGVVDLNDRYFKEVTETIRKTRQEGGQSLAQIIADYNQQHQSSSLINDWRSTPEWPVLKTAITKDQADIDRATGVMRIPSRLIVSMLVGEQLRLYNSEREIYKQVFAPLKILGVQSKFSWGVMGLKEETAIQIEKNLKDSSSPFYLGPEFEHLLDFTTTDEAGERFNRLTDLHSHYYSYLYTSIYLRQLMAQWERAGYNINDRPEILATLFNLGFQKSVPKAEPSVGGAEIEVGGQKYSFGSLAFQFYYSNELIANFPW